MLSHEGYGSIDYGDTPAYAGVYDASANVVGRGARRPRAGDERRVLSHVPADRRPAPCHAVPGGGLLRVQRLRRGDRDAAQPVRNEARRVRRHRRAPRRRSFLSVRRRSRPWFTRTSTRTGAICIPGTGAEYEMGKGAGEGLKLNIPMQPGWGDNEFFEAWERVLEHLREAQARVHRVPGGGRQPRRRSARASSVHAQSPRARRAHLVRARQRDCVRAASWGSAAAAITAATWRRRGALFWTNS